MVKTELKFNINSLFKNMTYFESYNVDIWITILIILIVIIITIYFYILNTIKSHKVNWETEKCNPFYMPFGSIINEGVSENFNTDNFQSCAKDLLFGLSIDLKNPISSLFSIFGGILGLASSVMSNIMSYFLYLFNMILNLLRQLLMILLKILAVIIEIITNIINTIGQILGFFAILYNQIKILIDSIKYLLPVIAASFSLWVVVPTIAFLIFAIGMIFFGWFLCGIPFGCIVGFPLAMLFTLIVAICICLLMFFLMILYNLIYGADRIIDMAEVKNLINRQTIPPDYASPEDAQKYAEENSNEEK